MVAACHRDAPQQSQPAPVPRDARLADAAVADDSYADLASALKAIIPDNARVLGFGELHARTDRAQVPSALSRFTKEVVPMLTASDLIVETWIVDPKCGKAAEEATAKVTVTMRRPIETKSEVAQLAEAARARKIQPHAMHVGCEDYAVIAPKGKEVDPAAMLTLTTRELTRLALEGLAKRPGQLAIYGGALHNDLYPAKGVAEWSYAAAVDEAAEHRYVEIDLIVPEFAEADPGSQKEPWFELVKRADARVRVWKRGERSYVVVLPKTPG